MIETNLIKQWAEAGDPNAAIKLAELYINEGKVEDAKKFLSQAAEKNYRPAAIRLAKILREEGNLAEAVTFYKKAVELDDVEAMDALIELYPDNEEILNFILAEIDKRYNDTYSMDAGRIFHLGSFRNEEYTPQYGEAIERRRIMNKVLQLKAEEA